MLERLINGPTLPVKNYPFTTTEELPIIRWQTDVQLRRLALLLPFSYSQQEQIHKFLQTHFKSAEKLFQKEQLDREKGESYANLHYHNVHHGVYQAGYDGAVIARGILQRFDRFSAHLSPEGALAIAIGAMYHDCGYTTATQSADNFAARTPVHVEESKQTLARAFDEIPTPFPLDKSRLSELAIVGIHHTYFPFTAEKKVALLSLIKSMPIEQRKEARIVGLSVQLADLGGQVARKDYFPTLVKALRKEMNCAKSGLGTQIIGSDEQLLENAQKFQHGVVTPSVGKTAHAFLGRDNAFSQAWYNLLSEKC